MLQTIKESGTDRKAVSVGDDESGSDSDDDDAEDSGKDD